MAAPYFQPPANLQDFQQAASYSAWSDVIGEWMDYAKTPTTVLNIDPDSTSFTPPPGFQSQFFNQKDNQDWPVNTAEVHWNGFPKRILQQYNGNQILAWENADDPQILSQSYFAYAATQGFYADQYIRVQDEYLEWFVHRDSNNQITRIDLTAEGPEYWQSLYDLEPDTILKLYQQYISPDVVLADLVYDGKYNLQNKWNTTLGCMHLCCPPNALSAEIILGAQGTAIRKDLDGNVITDSTKLIRCSQYGVASRNSDPTIGSAVNTIARTGNSISLENPVGLYISYIDTTGWTVNGNELTDEQLAKIVVCSRGTKGTVDVPGKGVRYTISVPADMGFSLSDIVINSSPLKYGGQIASVTTIHLTAIATTEGPGAQQAVQCVGTYPKVHALHAAAFAVSNVPHLRRRAHPNPA